MQTFMNTDGQGWTVLKLHCPDCNLSTQQRADLRKLNQRQKADALSSMDQRLRRYFRKVWTGCEHAKPAWEH